MNTQKVCDHGENSADLLQYADKIITGHFHFRDHRVYNEKQYVLYLGAPYQMDFGDRSQQRGVSIIDTDTMSVTFVENTISPKHFRIKTSELIEKKYGNLSEVVKDNIISLYVDVKSEALTIDLLSSKLQQYKPLLFRVEFDVLDQAMLDQGVVAEKMLIDIETAFHEFIEHIETRAAKKDVLNRCLELYKTCQTEP
jgi:hypothetical protein